MKKERKQRPVKYDKRLLVAISTEEMGKLERLADLYNIGKSEMVRRMVNQIHAAKFEQTP